MRLSLASLVAVLLLAGSVSAAPADYKKFAAMPDGERIEAVLKAPYLADFKAFVAKEHSEENLNFILEAPKGDHKKIYDMYVASSGSHTVNLPSPTKAALDALAAKKDYKSMDFTTAVKDIKNMIKNDTIRRFADARKPAGLKPADVAAIAAFKAQAEKAKTRAENVITKGADAISKDKGARDSLASGLKGELSKAKDAKLKIKDAGVKADDSYKDADKVLAEAMAKVDQAVKMIPKGGK